MSGPLIRIGCRVSLPLCLCVSVCTHACALWPVCATECDASGCFFRVSASVGLNRPWVHEPWQPPVDALLTVSAASVTAALGHTEQTGLHTASLLLLASAVAFTSNLHFWKTIWKGYVFRCWQGVGSSTFSEEILVIFFFPIKIQI